MRNQQEIGEILSQPLIEYRQCPVSIRHFQVGLHIFYANNRPIHSALVFLRLLTLNSHPAKILRNPTDHSDKVGKYFCLHACKSLKTKKKFLVVAQLSQFTFHIVCIEFNDKADQKPLQHSQSVRKSICHRLTQLNQGRRYHFGHEQFEHISSKARRICPTMQSFCLTFETEI